MPETDFIVITKRQEQTFSVSLPLSVSPSKDERNRTQCFFSTSCHPSHHHDSHVGHGFYGKGQAARGDMGGGEVTMDRK